MKSELVLAINQLCAERKLSPEVVMEAVQASLISAYKRNFGATANIEVRMDPDTGDVRVFAAKEVVETVVDRKAQITLDEARLAEPGLQLGDTVLIESTPKDFGRIAAQTAKQVILQRIREAERDALYSTFADSAGEIAHGTVQSVDFHSQDVVVNIDGAEALLPAREQMPGEHYRRGLRLRAYVLEVRKGSRGPQITLSRRTPALLRRLLELEVPEIFHGTVEIKAIAREAGSRSKVAVYATQEGVDPVGSCVGVRGGRIQNVVNELGGEKIDVVEWNPDIAAFISNSLSPAKVMNVRLEDTSESNKTATVIVPDRQLSLAIGKEGQNARLAAKLTGWRIDIKSASEAAEETLGRLEDIKIAPEDMDLLTLAESLLRTQDTTGFTPEQQRIVEQVVQEREGVPGVAASGLALEKEQASEELARQGAEAALPSEAEPAAAAEAEAMAEGVAPAVEPEKAGPEVQVPGEGETPARYRAREDVLLDEIEPAQLPSPDGEPAGESIGWVQGQPPEEYFDWTAQGQAEDLVWVRDEVEVEEVQEVKTSKKKKDKRRSRTDRHEEELEAILRKPRKGGRTRGR